MSARALALALALFATGCVSIHERTWTDSAGKTHTERSVNGVVSSGYGNYYNSGSVAVINRGGVNRQPEIRVYDTSPAPVLYRIYDRHGNVVIMNYICPDGRQPVAHKC